MKKTYQTPDLTMMVMGELDVITTSGDNWMEWDTTED